MRVHLIPRPLLAAGVVALLSVRPSVADETALDLTKRALAECMSGREAKGRSERETRFERGRALAERAVALDDSCADAHFAVFCNMGEAMRLDGESLEALVGLGKLMKQLDRTLQLDPRHHDAMASKGQLLMRLPRLLGGDASEGERLLRTVISKDPNAFSSRLLVAQACNSRGEQAEAKRLAQRALEIAHDQGRADRAAEAEAVLEQLGSAH